MKAVAVFEEKSWKWEKRMRRMRISFIIWYYSRIVWMMKMCENSFFKKRKKSKSKNCRSHQNPLYTFNSIHCSHSLPFLKALSASCSSPEDASSQITCTHSGTETGSWLLEPGSLWLTVVLAASQPFEPLRILKTTSVQVLTSGTGFWEVSRNARDRDFLGGPVAGTSWS